MTDGDRPGGVDLTNENAALRREVARLTDERTATSQVLGMIAASAGEVEPVFEAILANAMRLCQAEMGHVYRVDDNVVTPAATHGSPPEHQERLRARGAWRPDPRTGVAEAIRLKKPVQLDDLSEHPLYSEGHEDVVAMVEDYGLKTLLHVPMLKAGDVIGVIVLYRNEVRPFDRKHIDLVDDFAAQAVIAIENARLLSELRESLDNQTASAEILRTIAAAPAQPEQALNTIAETTVGLFGATGTTIRTVNGDRLRLVGSAGPAVPGLRAVLGDETPITPDTLPGYTVLQKEGVHIPDIDNPDPKFAHWPGLEPLRAVGIRSEVSMPLMREGRAIGVIIVQRRELKPFNDKELAQLANFADQAVIAIENARLLSELRESLDNQTASAEILRTIASDPEEAGKALDTIAQTTARLFDASGLNVAILEDGVLRFAAIVGESVQRVHSEIGETPPDPRRVSGAAILEKRQIHIPDLTDPEARARWPNIALSDVEDGSVAATPLLRQGEAIGVLVVVRKNSRPFTKWELAQLSNFADQAVIAIENARLLGELRESLEYQTASSEVLRVIAESTTDFGPVMTVISENAARLCEARDVRLYQIVDGKLRSAETLGPIAPLGPNEIPIDRGSLAGRAVVEKRLVHEDDMAAVAETYPHIKPTVTQTRFGSVLGVPMLREGRAIGAIIALREDVRPFGRKQRDLISNFADQAAIAIENARLLEELQARNRDLSESLEQQTATSEILRAIASAQGEAGRVLDTIAETAHRLFGAYLSVITRIEDGVFHQAAVAGPEAATISGRMSGLPVDRDSVGGRAATELRTVHFEDLWEHADELPNSPGVRGGVKTRTIAAAPLLRDGQAIGTIGITLSEVRPFTEKQLTLLESFADQAVIAIENARLLSELRESLERRTATADVLAVISSSPGDVQPVFETMLDKAVAICDASEGSIFTRSEDIFLRAASRGLTEEMTAYREVPAKPGTPPAEMLRTGRTIHLPDLQRAGEEDGAFPGLSIGRVVIERGGRSALWVPMVKDGAVVGAFVLLRRVVGPFSDNQVGLIENFASQAVIAIENTRLLEELRESLENQTASADILRVISSSAADTQPVFDAIVAAGLRLFPGVAVSIALPDGDQVYAAAASDLDSERAAKWRNRFPFPLERQYMHSACILDRRVIDIPDVMEAPEEFAVGRQNFLASGYRGVTMMPMIRGEEAIGALSVVRVAPGPLTDKQHELLKTFADQAVIAIENARLLEELRSARDAAERAVDELKDAQASLIHAEKMASLGQLTAGIAHEIKNPLNFVNNFAGLSVELLDELKETAGPAFATLADDDRNDVDEVIGMLTGNLEKVAEHGKRADGIVKSMLAHSRGGSGDRQSVDLNALIEESLNLAYHGARAQDQDFNITMEREFDTSLGPIEVVPQELTRVLLNLFGNGFYAANKRARESGGSNFEPTLKISTCDTGVGVEIRIRDNGTGIPAELQEKLFEPFFTTKPTGEGTGLGLSISYEIVTKQHGGTITVESEPGEFTEFCITLPRQTRG